MAEAVRRYRVLLTKAATKDIEDIHDYIAYVLCAPETAKSLCQRFRKAILDLEFFPRRYESFDPSDSFLKEYRRIPVENYLIVYVIVNDDVIVTNVFYGASDVIEKLKG